MNLLNVGYASTNYYLLEQAGRRLLVDVGWPGTLPRLSAVLRRTGLVLEKINWVCATHYHPDHAGLIQELKDRGVRHMLLEPQWLAVPELRRYMKPDSGYVPIRLANSLRLALADSRAWLAQLGLAGEFVATPGHSPDSVSLVLADGLAFTGDLTPPEMLGVDQAPTAQASWERLRQLGVQRVYPGHGPARPIAGWPAQPNASGG